MAYQEPMDSAMTREGADQKSREVSELRSKQIKDAVPKGQNQWSRYDR